MRKNSKKALLGLLCVFLMAGTILGERKTLVLKDGRRITGEVTKTPTGYRVEKKLGVVLVGFDQVVKVEDAPDPVGEYKRRREKIDTSNPQALYTLAEWASDSDRLAKLKLAGVRKTEIRNMLKEARADLKAALKLKSDFEKASLLLKVLEEELGPTSVGPVRPIPTTRPDKSKLDKLLLPQEDVYRVRVAELDLWYDRGRLRGRDTRILVKFQDDALNRFVELVRGTDNFKQPRFREIFKSFTPVKQVAIMLEHLGRDDNEIRDDILIRSDPVFMKEFRRTVWPIVSQSCAQSQCHGGEKVNGGMKLFTIAGKNERMDYTNFVILSGIRKKGSRRVIDRGEHDRSLLLEFGLPHKLAAKSRRHPKIIKPVFTSTRSVNYRRVMAWIKSLEGPQHPDYRLKYVAPYGMVLHTDGRPDLPLDLDKPSGTGKKGAEK